MPYSGHEQIVKFLCEKMKLPGEGKPKDIADGVTAEFLARKLPLRGAAKAVLLQLAELCSARSSAHNAARGISRELFFGYVLQKADFYELER